MTIQEFVLSQPVMGINGWLKAINSANLQKHEHTIIACACHFNRITVNHSASFGKESINH
jgi:hypothetical protein